MYRKQEDFGVPFHLSHVDVWVGMGHALSLRETDKTNYAPHDFFLPLGAKKFLPLPPDSRPEAVDSHLDPWTFTLPSYIFPSRC